MTDRSSFGPGVAVLRRLAGGIGLGAGVVLDDLDAHLGEDEEQFLELRGRDLDVAQRRRHVSAAQAAQLVALLDEARDFGAVDQRHGGRGGLVCRSRFGHALSPAVGPAPR